MESSQRRWIITGGTGLLGKTIIAQLQQQFSDEEIIVFSRNDEQNIDGVTIVQYDPKNRKIDQGFIPQKGDVIFHLAGAGIADKSWTKSRKQILISSRVDTIQTLFSYYDVAQVKPRTVVSASGVNCYPMNTEEKLSEDAAYGDDFLSDIVKKWEAAVNDFSRISRVVTLRIGMVLAPDGGALDRLKGIVKKNVGAPLGSGKQPMPFVHVDDVANAFIFSAENTSVEGAYNCIADEIPTNKAFMKSLGKAMSKKIIPINVPGFILKLGLGKMSEMLLNGVNVSNQKIKEEGFQFEKDTIEKALKACV